MVSVLRLPSDDIEEFYYKAVGIIREGMEKMVMSYRLLCISLGRQLTHNVKQG